MKVKDAVLSLEKSDEYSAWKKGHEGFYLAHLFRMLDEPNEDSWQVGYYDDKADSIASFLVEPGAVSIIEESEAFKRPEASIKKLDLSKVKIDIDEAIEKAEHFRKEKYSPHQLMKMFIILQHLDEGQVYNITILTTSFKTLNLKVDSASGDVVSHDLVSLMDLGKPLD